MEGIEQSMAVMTLPAKILDLPEDYILRLGQLMLYCPWNFGAVSGKVADSWKAAVSLAQASKYFLRLMCGLLLDACNSALIEVAGALSVGTKLPVVIIKGACPIVPVVGLMRFSGVLTTLGLRGNKIKDDGAIAVADALRGNGVLTKLDLYNNNIGPAGAVAIADALKFNRVLTTLYLQFNSIGAE